MGWTGKHVAPRQKGKGLRRFGRAIPLALAFVLAMGAVAFADTVFIENTIGVNDNVTKAPGSTGTGHVRLEVTNGTPATDTNGCNATGSESLTVNLQSSNPKVTITSSSVVVAGCGVAFPFDYSIAADATGSAIISVSSVSGGRTDGTRLYATSDTLVITVSAPSDTENPQNASITINDGDTWTNSATVSLDISATDNVGITRYRLAESSAGLATATDVAVDPAEASLSRTNQSFTLSGEDGAAREVWLQVFDAVGNSATASDSIGLDRVLPTVTCNAASFLLNQPNAEVTATITDGLSGPLNTTESAAADTTSAGTGQTVSITGYDNAGNSASADCAYSVGYNFDGLYAPVDRPNTLNVSKAGQAVPLKWRLTDYFGTGVSDLTAVSVSVAGLNCSLGTTVDTLEEYASGSSGLQNQGDGYYQFNWKTPTSYASSCKSLSIKMGIAASNAPVHSNLANFQFKK